MRKTYEFDGATFVCRTPDITDFVAVDGKLPILPEGDAQPVDPSNYKLVVVMVARADQFLLRCGINPEFIEISPVDIPPNQQPLRELDPALRMRLFSALLRDAGFTAKEAAEVRPTEETSAVS